MVHEQGPAVQGDVAQGTSDTRHAAPRRRQLRRRQAAPHHQALLVSSDECVATLLFSRLRSNATGFEGATLLVLRVRSNAVGAGPTYVLQCQLAQESEACARLQQQLAARKAVLASWRDDATASRLANTPGRTASRAERAPWQAWRPSGSRMHSWQQA